MKLTTKTRRDLKKISLPGCVLDAIHHYEIEPYDSDRHIPGMAFPEGKEELVEAVRPVHYKNRATVALTEAGVKCLIRAIDNAYDIQEHGGDYWDRWPGKRSTFLKTLQRAREALQ